MISNVYLLLCLPFSSSRLAWRQPSCLRISRGSGGGLCNAISCLSHWRTCSLSGLPDWYMANSLPMLDLRSSAFNIGLANAEPFAQDQSRGRPAPPCLANATVLQAALVMPVELASQPPRHGLVRDSACTVCRKPTAARPVRFQAFNKCRNSAVRLARRKAFCKALHDSAHESVCPDQTRQRPAAGLQPAFTPLLMSAHHRFTPPAGIFPRLSDLARAMQ